MVTKVTTVIGDEETPKSGCTLAKYYLIGVNSLIFVSKRNYKERKDQSENNVKICNKTFFCS